jgi:hypothetical protein
MNYWIQSSRQELTETLKLINILLINDGEAKMLAGEGSLPRAARKVLAMGPQALVIKHGEYGATIFFREGAFGIGTHPFRAPALPIEEVKDPTGAGDSFAGGFMGYIASQEQLNREVLKRAMGGVLLIDEAYYLYRPENERDYGQEAIEILLQVMENQREDLVVILAGYADRMEKFFASNPGFRSRIAHHIDFPDYTDDELLAIGELILAKQNYKLSPAGREALARYIAARKQQPHFSNARSIRNALDRARLRQANRIVQGAAGVKITADDLMTIDAPDILASRVFGKEAAPSSPLSDETENNFD